MMNEHPMTMMRKASVERAIRETIADPRAKAEMLKMTGWDDSMPSKVLGGAGITLEKLDKVLDSIGMVVVSRRYLAAMQTLSEVGTHCHCAMQGLGECGIGRAA